MTLPRSPTTSSTSSASTHAGASSASWTRPILFLSTYAAWVLVFRLLALSCFTYFMTKGGVAPTFGEIDEAFTSNELTLMGLASLLYVLLLAAFYPILGTRLEEIFTGKRFEKLFVPGFFHGALLALGMVVVFLMTGLYRYFGVPFQAGESALPVVTVLIRVLALGTLAYCEEFIFRHKIWNHLKTLLPVPKAAALTALAYCGLKLIQFDLGIMHMTTLFLMSAALSIRGLMDRDFVRGAGFFAGILIVFQPLLGLPLLGTEFSGALLIKHAEPTTLVRLLTGGRGGPLSSLSFQFLLVVDIVRSYLRHRNEIVEPSK